MEIYKKIEYITKIKRKNIYRKAVYYGFFFQEMPFRNKLKADKLQKKQTREGWKNKDQVMLCHLRDKQSAALLSFRNRP
jgi:hypothetical protein